MFGNKCVKGSVKTRADLAAAVLLSGAVLEMTRDEGTGFLVAPVALRRVRLLAAPLVLVCWIATGVPQGSTRGESGSQPSSASSVVSGQRPLTFANRSTSAATR